MKQILIITAIVMALQNFVMAQEQTGLHFDNYTASSGMLLNPAATFASPNRWEINVVSAGVFAQNNYLYFNHQSVLSLEHAYMKSSIADPEVFYSNTNQIKVYTLGFVQGPSAFVKMGRINGGIFTDARSIVSGHSDIMVAPLRLDSLAYDEIYHVPAFNTAMMNWSEVGFNLGAELLHTDKSSLSGAVNMKFLGGFDGMYFHNNESFEFEKISETQLTNFNRFNATFGYTSNVGTNHYSFPTPVNGTGLGADVGFIFTTGNSAPGKYNWKFGASMIDIGRIHFTKQAGTYSLVSNSDLSASIPELQQIFSLGALNATASEIINGDATSSQTGNDFYVGLPTALTFQIEKSFNHRFFVGAVATQRTPLSATSLYRPNVLIILPRYETKWFSATVPVEFYEYQQVHVGAALRMGPLTIGSDNLFSWVKKGKLEGSDIYAGLRIFPFGDEETNNSKRSKANVKSYHSQHKVKGLGCPKF